MGGCKPTKVLAENGGESGRCMKPFADVPGRLCERCAAKPEDHCVCCDTQIDSLEGSDEAKLCCYHSFGASIGKHVCLKCGEPAGESEAPAKLCTACSWTHGTINKCAWMFETVG